ncbi:DUF2075 domain-containing protein [Bacillus sp. AR2-1]|nr:DUF2075 domain-containing protein [Bacillus sp. AR2-1]
MLEGSKYEKVDLKKYDLRILDSLVEIDYLLKQKISDGYRVKWLAPFCWKWNGEVNDISITDEDDQLFEKAWNSTVAK